MTLDNALSIGATLKNALANYGRLCPHHSVLTAVAQKSNINYKKLERAVKDEAQLTVEEFGAVMVVCCYPEGFHEVKHFYFPQLQ